MHSRQTSLGDGILVMTQTVKNILDTGPVVAHQHHVTARRKSRMSSGGEVTSNRRAGHAQVIAEGSALKTEFFTQNSVHPAAREPSGSIPMQPRSWWRRLRLTKSPWQGMPAMDSGSDWVGG